MYYPNIFIEVVISKGTYGWGEDSLLEHYNKQDSEGGQSDV